MKMTEPFVRFEQYQKSDGVEEYFEDGNSFSKHMTWQETRECHTCVEWYRAEDLGNSQEFYHTGITSWTVI